MSEEAAIRSTGRPYTTDTIYEDLRELGIKSGELLLVHSSLSSIGWVCGGVPAFIEALLKAVGAEGTLVMPAHSGHLSDPANWVNPPVPKDWFEIIYKTMPVFDPRITPTRGIGSVAELFRTYPGTLRSDHPQVSFAANGPLAAEITASHNLTPMMGMNTPLGALYERRAKILLVGVGYNRCTSFHLAEACAAILPRERVGAPILENGERIWKWFEDYQYDNDDFETIGFQFEQINEIKIGKVGNAACRLLDMKTAVDFAVEWVKNNRSYRPF